MTRRGQEELAHVLDRSAQVAALGRGILAPKLQALLVGARGDERLGELSKPAY